MEKGEEKINDLNLELNRLVLQKSLKKASYYLFNLFAKKEGGFSYSFDSHWIGWANKEFTQEIREPSLVNPVLTIKVFREMKEPVLVINNERDLAIFLYFLGGHSIIEKSLGDKYLNHCLRPASSIYTYDGGHIDVKSIPEKMLKRAPDPKLRMKVLTRDKRRCMICGASPRDNEHVELHLHHIQPFGKGGLTSEKNLITLCHTCHKGLDPHIDHSLYEYINVSFLSIKEIKEDYIDKIQRNVEELVKWNKKRSTKTGR
jgi:hypothetical protein